MARKLELSTRHAPGTVLAHTAAAMECRAWPLLMVALAVTVGCSDDASTRATPADAALDDVTADVQTEDAADAAVESYGVPFCTELGVENVLPYDTTIANDFALKVMGDCRVIQLLLPLSQPEAASWLETTAAWIDAFFGCPGTAGSVKSFGPVETGKSPVMSQTDIDVLVEHFAVAIEQSLSLSSDQSAALRSELVRVAASAVNLPIPEHALSLCTDSGAPDAGADAADAAAESDAGSVDAGAD